MADVKQRMIDIVNSVPEDYFDGLKPTEMVFKLMVEYIKRYGEDETTIIPGTDKHFNYETLKEKNYYHDECDYGCFLFQRGIENDKYMNNIYYYIKNGNLYAIRPFKIYSSFKEENYFSTKHFLIQITQ